MISPIASNKIVSVVDPIVATVTVESSAVDRLTFGKALMIALQGISGDTLSGSLKWTISFQESDAPGSGYANIAAAHLEGGLNDHVIDAAAEDPTTIIRGYRGSKRYVRIVWTATGTHSNGTPIAGLCLLEQPNYIPVTQPAELGG